MQIVLFGALGEVGTHLSGAFTRGGHEVIPVSSRQVTGAVSHAEALDLVTSGSVDLVVSASGPGDRREVDRTGLQAVRALESAGPTSKIPAILISTTRVLEGHPGKAKETDVGAATTRYASANLANENAWLELSSFSPRVLRLTNFFAEPRTQSSGQTSLLPWSLVTDALETGRIVVRSDPSVSREFVDAQSIAAAIEAMIANVDQCPSRIATAPGTTLSLSALCDCIEQAFTRNSLNPPEVTFGTEMQAPARVEARWLTSMGWSCTLTPASVTDTISSYLANHVT